MDESVILLDARTVKNVAILKGPFRRADRLCTLARFTRIKVKLKPQGIYYCIPSLPERPETGWILSDDIEILDNEIDPKVGFKGYNDVHKFGSLLCENRYTDITQGFLTPGFDWSNSAELKKMIGHLANHLQKNTLSKKDRKQAENLFENMVVHGSPIFDLRRNYAGDSYFKSLLNRSMRAKKDGGQILHIAIKKAIDSIFPHFPEKLIEEIVLFVPPLVTHLGSEDNVKRIRQESSCASCTIL